MAVPHGVGSVWAQGAWEVYWKLVDAHGFSTDLYNAAGDAGNQRAMLYVNEGLKNTACNPTFTQIRDGIIQAAADNHGGEDVCRMWEAFAAFGLGSNAVSGGANSLSPTNGFNVPASCQGGGGTTVFSDTFRDRARVDHQPEWHRHGHDRAMGTRRSRSHRLQRAQAAGHHGQRHERPRDRAARGIERRRE
jgi:hypothetical protein